MDPPHREWLIEGLVPANSVHLLYSDGGLGKSLLSLQLGVAVASGREWLGKDVETGRAVILSAEDDKDEVHRRLDDICAADEIAAGELEGLDIVDMVGSDCVLGSPEKGRGLIKASAVFEQVEIANSREETCIVRHRHASRHIRRRRKQPRAGEAVHRAY